MTASMKGLEKAALFLLSVGEETAARIFKHLDDRLVSTLSSAMSTIRQIPDDKADAVMDEFLNDLSRHSSTSVDSFRYLRQVLDNSLGERRAAELMDYVMRGGGIAMTMEVVRGTDPRALAEQLRNERPQAVALTLAHVDAAMAAEVLSRFPDDMARDVLYRYARLDAVQPTALRELSRTLGEQLSGHAGEQQLSGIGGTRRTAEILNNLESSVSEKLLEGVATRDEETAEAIRESMFTFNDLMNLDSLSLQTLLRDVSNEQLAMALKVAAPEVRDKLLAHLSERAATSVREDLEGGPPIRRADAESAQKEILQIARRLDSEGRITIAGDEELL